MNKNLIEDMKIEELLVKYPFAEAFFSENAIEVAGHEDKTFAEVLDKFRGEELEDMALDKELLKRGLSEYIEQMKAFLGMEEEKGVEVLTILAGNDK